MRMTNRTSTTLRPASGRAGGGRIKGQAVNVLLARFGCGGQERRRLRRLGETADILLARFENIGTQVLEASVNSGLLGFTVATLNITACLRARRSGQCLNVVGRDLEDSNRCARFLERAHFENNILPPRR